MFTSQFRFISALLKGVFFSITKLQKLKSLTADWKFITGILFSVLPLVYVGSTVQNRTEQNYTCQVTHRWHIISAILIIFRWLVNISSMNGMNGQTFAEAILLLAFLPFFSVGRLLKKRISSCSKFFALINDPPPFERALSLRKANRKSRKLFVFVKMPQQWECTHESYDLKL